MTPLSGGGAGRRPPRGRLAESKWLAGIDAEEKWRIVETGEAEGKWLAGIHADGEWRIRRGIRYVRDIFGEV